MHSDDSDRVSRRRTIEALGAAGVIALAGCSGSGGSGGGSTDSGSGGSGGGSTDSGSGGSGGGSTEIEIWTNVHGQSKAAERFLQNQINQYEQQTGNTVTWLKEPVTNVQNGNWLQRMEAGEGPTMFQTSFSRTGAFIANGHVTPWGDIMDRMDDSVISGTEWAHEQVRNVFRGFSGETLKLMPYGFAMQEPFVARKDHFEQAGLSIEDDFPPTNTEELIDVATTLKEDGPADIGFQVHGAPGDLMDEITPTWAVSRGGASGLYVNESWDDTLLDSDAWKSSLGRQVRIFRELGLSAENSSGTSDEDAVRLIINGDASMSQVGMLNYGIFQEQASDLLSDGTIQFGASWPGEADNRGEFNMFGFGINSKPDGMDSQTWDRKLTAAIEFLNHFGSVEVQQNILQNFGVLPFNRNAWEQISATEDNFFTAIKTIAEGSSYGWQAHPDMADIQYNIPGPIFQQAMTGQISPEEACNRAAERIRQRVF